MQSLDCGQNFNVDKLNCFSLHNNKNNNNNSNTCNEHNNKNVTKQNTIMAAKAINKRRDKREFELKRMCVCALEQRVEKATA